MDLLFLNPYQQAPQACITDVTAPTFAGIATLVPQANGSLLATWLAATGSFTLPAFYDVYIAPGAGVADGVLFQASNIVCTKRGLSAKIWTLADETTFLGVNQPYTVGVRARTSTNIGETNVAKISAVSEGVIPDCFTQVYADLLAQVTALTTQVTLLTAENVTFASSNATLISSLSDLADEIADFSAENAVYIAQNAALAASVANLNALLNQLQSAILVIGGGVEGQVGDVEGVDGEVEC